MSGGGGEPVQINNTENKVGALRVQSSTQGMPVAIAYGTTRVTPNLIYYNDFTATAHTTVTNSGGGGGGKGGGGGGGVQTSTTTYTYSVCLLLGLCEGPLPGLGGEGGGIGNYVVSSWNSKARIGSGSGGFDQYNGTNVQEPYGYIVTNHPAEALAYRNTAYLAAGQFALGAETSVPNFSFEVSGFLTFSQCSPDANPAEVLEDVLTAEAYGANWPGPYLGDLDDFYTYCAASNFLCSPLYAKQMAAADIVRELCLIGNSAPVWSEGLLKIKPYGDEVVSYTPYIPGGCGGSCIPGDLIEWTPDLTIRYHLTADDFIADSNTDPISIARKRQSDSFNQVKLEILDRANEYNISVAEASDLANIELFGLRPAEVVILHPVCDVNIGRNIAQVQLQRMLFVRNEYTFQLPWKYARLEPMDIVSLTDEQLALDNYPVRITCIEEDEDGMLVVTAEDLALGAGTPGAYASQDSAGSTINSDVPPGDAAEPIVFQPPVELSGVPQIWIGTAGGLYWGGAEVWASDDGSSYSQLGVLSAPSRYGQTTNNVPAGPDPDLTTTISVDLGISTGALTSATTVEADSGDTLCWLDGEIIAYTQAELTAPSEYNLDTYIRRGLRCSFSGDHPAGSPFARLDSTIGKFGVTPARVGGTIYIKLLSFNIYGRAKQSLGDVSPWPYTVGPLGIVAANGVLPDTITAEQVLCIPPATQMSIVGRMTILGRINCDGRLLVL